MIDFSFLHQRKGKIEEMFPVPHMPTHALAKPSSPAGLGNVPRPDVDEAITTRGARAPGELASATPKPQIRSCWVICGGSTHAFRGGQKLPVWISREN